MKKLILLITLIFSLNASAFWCETFDKAIDVGTVSIASILECERPELIKKDLVTLFNYDYFCTEAKGPFCTILAEAISNSLPMIVPEEWECKLNLASRLTRASVEFMCNKI